MADKANVQAERSKSLWLPAPHAVGEPLADSRPADLVVVGSGIAGLSVAYQAARDGRSVMVLDRAAIGSGMTARTTGHLACTLDDFYYEFIGLRGEDEARLLYQSQAAAIDRIEQIARDEAIDCDFRRCDGYLFLGEGDDPAILEKEFEACRKIGFDGVRWITGAPFPTGATGRCLIFPNQARFHPLKYLQGLVQAIQRLGGRFHPFTPVDSIKETSAGVNVALTNGQNVVARDVVNATNAPIAGRLTLQAKMAPYRTYAVAVSVPKGTVVDALYWDTLDAYHYVRIQPRADDDALIVGGEDHKTGEADDAEGRFEALLQWTRGRVVTLGPVIARWSGQVLEPVDHAGFVGRDPDNDHIFFVTGDSGQGLTNGATAGILLPALLQGIDHPWQKLYDPARMTVRSVGTFISENVTAVRSFAEHLGGALRPSADDLSPGEGGLIGNGINSVAAYRDETGMLHKVSATCSHAGCTVHFNTFERCWDCPCHGSHFDIDGGVLNAPATAPLKPVKD
jgi:glycine/D-amino acid oxidase-like deaminating enzyme/nitrite reductase/ring-hydroxylating ferredoxin subunit